MYRVRMVSNANNGQHAFYSTAVRKLAEAVRIVEDMDKVIVRCSMAIQTSETPGRCGQWTTMHYSQWSGLLSHVSTIWGA